MSRRVAVVLGLTFVALVGATAYVPTDTTRSTVVRRSRPAPPSASGYSGRFGGLANFESFTAYSWAWQLGTSEIPNVTTSRSLRWRVLIPELLVIVALGGLLALVLRTRQARRAA